MTELLNLCSRSALWLDRMAPLVLPTLARFVFAAVLLVYFWGSALTKLGDGPLGLFRPSSGAYVQIFPKAMEAAGYDASALGLWHWVVVVAGTSAEFLLPALLLIGLCTRLAALGMLGFVAVQTLTDLFGHGDATPAGLSRCIAAGLGGLGREATHELLQIGDALLCLGVRRLNARTGLRGGEHEVVVVAGVDFQLLKIQIRHVRAHLIEEVPIVADDDHRRV